MVLLLAALGALLLLAAACDDGEDGAVSTPSSEATRSAEATPATSPQGSSDDTVAPLYIALGDSLAAGTGASNASSTAYVPLFHEYLREALENPDLALLNLGHGGDTSADLIEEGRLARAVDEIRARNFDESPDNDVQAVTLDIGGNDLLGLFFSLVIPGTCPDVETFLAEPRCFESFQDTLDGLRGNFDQALDELGQADPDLPVLTADLYNPFSGAEPAVDELAEAALEGREGSPVEEGLNDVIRSVAREHGVPVADWYLAFQGKSSEFVSSDQIHPSDAGYRAMTDALIAVYEGAGG